FLQDMTYNRPLWTMGAELYGSLGIFVVQAVFTGLGLAFGGFRFRFVIYTLLTLFLFGTTYLGFVLGMALCDAYHHDRIRLLADRYARVWVPIAILVGLVLGGYGIRGLYTNPYSMITVGGF